MEIIDEIRSCKTKIPGHPYQSPSKLLKELQEYCETHQIEHDFYGKGQFLNTFEQELADSLGFAGAVFMPSGTMAQGIAARIYSESQKTPNIALHGSSHLLNDEHFGGQFLHDFKWQMLGHSDQVIRAKDLTRLHIPVACTVLELPMRRLGGLTISWDDLEEIKANKKNPLHLDGARIWEVQPYYNKSLKSICDGFDSAYVSFYKGLGALPGAMLLGDQDFIAQARYWLRRCGGNLISLTTQAVSAKMNLDLRSDKFTQYFEGAKKLSSLLNSISNLSTHDEVQSNIVQLNFHGDSAAMNAQLKKLRLNQSLHICAPFVKTKYAGLATTEISVGDNLLDINDEALQEILETFSKVTSSIPRKV